MEERDAQIRAIGAEFPGWEAWQGLVNGLWHARLAGSAPPVMVHGDSAADVREAILCLARGHGHDPVPS